MSPTLPFSFTFLNINKAHLLIISHSHAHALLFYNIPPHISFSQPFIPFMCISFTLSLHTLQNLFWFLGSTFNFTYFAYFLLFVGEIFSKQFWKLAGRSLCTLSGNFLTFHQSAIQTTTVKTKSPFVSKFYWRTWEIAPCHQIRLLHWLLLYVHCI